MSSSEASFELDRLQRWMQSVITHPRSVSSGVASTDARRSIDVDILALETILEPSATLSAEQRLAIYWRSYQARLLECFTGMFPALFHALGEELFNLFALDYLQSHPPHSYTLDHLADDFAQHLAETRPDANANPGEREDWPDFLVELASLEWAFLKIYDGPGMEGRQSPNAEDLLSIELTQISELRPVLAPCLRLFAFRYPVHAYMLAARRGELPGIPEPAANFVAVTRRKYLVEFYELSEPQHLFLRALAVGNSVSEALNQVNGIVDCQPSLKTIQNWLCDWTGKGFLETVAA